MIRKTGLKNTAAAILIFALSGAVLAGCGQSPQDTPQNTSQELPSDTGANMPENEISDNSSKDAEKNDSPNPADGAGQSTDGNPDNDSADETAQEPETYEDNFAVDSQAAKEFAEKIQAAVAQQDLEALAALTAFPVYVGLPDAGGVETKEDFLNLGADAVFTDELSESVQAADIENLQPSMAGFSISNGGTANISFGVRDGRLAINGINY